MIICTCNEVREEDVVKAIDNGAASYDDVSRATRAGRSCGSCAPLVVDILLHFAGSVFEHG
jgi:NAD(P)H-nitrite reductase large subunit